jgi:ferredoxin
MSSVQLTINNRLLEVPQDCTIMEAAQRLGIAIPSLCFLKGGDRFTSCMVCVVEEMNSGQLLPSCSAAAAEGMRIETDTERVRDARKAALDFLLSEHVGDCEAPCQRACPAHMNIPLMIRQIEAQQYTQAIQTVKQHIAIPAVLGRICSAPCEKGCNRKYYDSPVAVCLLKRFAADMDLAQASSLRPDLNSRSGKRVAIIGTGPTGLSAAYYLLQAGHSCSLFDKNPEPGGMLRYGVTEDKLPRAILDAEIDEITSALGAEFHLGCALGADISWEEISSTYDAVVLAVGRIEPETFKDTHIGNGLEMSARGIAVDKKTYMSSKPGVFAGGNAIGESRLAVRAAAHGKGIAVSVDQFLRSDPGTLNLTGIVPRFNSIMGKPRESELEEFIQEASRDMRVDPEGGFETGYTEREAVLESSRCFGCDCRKLDTCQLRELAQEYGAEQQRFKFNQRGEFQKIIQHDLVVYEPGKCIKCGKCVQITRNLGEKYGLAFVNRGFDVRIDVPFHESLKKGLIQAAEACIAACPTAALSRLERV